MALDSILIINKSGGLIYHRNFEDPRQPAKESDISKMNSNDYLILASTLHGVFAIATQLTPTAVQLKANSSASGSDASAREMDSVKSEEYSTVSSISNSSIASATGGAGGVSNTAKVPGPGAPGPNKAAANILNQGHRHLGSVSSGKKDGNNGRAQISNLTPYIPYVGMPHNNIASGGNSSANSPMDMGSFKGDDFFKEPFVSWNTSGIRHMSTDQFTMFIYQTMTGLKFVAIKNNQVVGSPSSNTTDIVGGIHLADNLLRKVYCLYSDYVMKDPFYSLEMPIKSTTFDEKLQQMIQNMNW
ncbi:uncharacterized protein GVI51_K11077 [Nakaseomyces glabratus]|uniref:Trafficking protein particle complex subunit n=1 Tax=Candida glabrata (strain ATCC 2001 / BCRC 20586 / JCM 3761 / NBRC 0622 / NRRL Y-65 / CBS 138) TaxID=284593 RepID=Q6FM40_CANGA|nr:uncharacterized protein CAGL0K11253g [Nakaseomyces glabratus]KAH7597272.1 Sybindin-like family [Nakaseomyces glabratus]KAH7603044.1 Sybindin-like family [Nakaseomyces glabratus]QHS68370.1 uncharacterized protein GVI51_K11077 [Nakaseomyces glabratus]CAG61667.1 unnamed protein product [Nakaseomyces glabratus]|eukprot:XP_448704.1 uncharacterized protein CAGL0K11253g [[Candida] glabrata]